MGAVEDTGPVGSLSAVSERGRHEGQRWLWGDVFKDDVGIRCESCNPERERNRGEESKNLKQTIKPSPSSLSCPPHPPCVSAASAPECKSSRTEAVESRRISSENPRVQQSKG